MVEGTGRATMNKSKADKTPQKRSDTSQAVDKEMGRLKTDWASRMEQLKAELVSLQQQPTYKDMVKDMLNLIKALEVRERILEIRETTIFEKERSLDGQKQKLSAQAERLAQLRNELESKISELEQRLAALEDVE